MRITLAVPHDGHDVGETIDVDDADGKRLLRDGFARLPDRNEQTVSELRDYAKTQGIDIAGLSRKADIAAAIEAAETISVSPTTTVTPVTGEED
jgi:hypothetical protein